MKRPRYIELGALDLSEQQRIAAAIRRLDAIPTGGPPAAVFEALRACAPVIGGMIGVMGAEMSSAAISHVVGLPTEVIEGWATTPLEHLHRMMAPLVPAQPGDLISDRTAITGVFRERLELLRVLRSAGLGETAGYKVAARSSRAGKPENRFLTVALEGSAVFTDRQRALFHLLQPAVESTLERMAVPIVASEPIFSQIIEEQRTGYVCLSSSHAIVELNQRAHDLVFRYLPAAHVLAGRGCLVRFAEKAVEATAGGRTWSLLDAASASIAEVSTHRLAKEIHHAGDDLTLVMIRALDMPLLAQAARPEGVTDRQMEVAHLLATTDLSYKQLADRLGVADGTVRKHVERVYRAFGVTSRTALAFKLR